MEGVFRAGGSSLGIAASAAALRLVIVEVLEVAFRALLFHELFEPTFCSLLSPGRSDAVDLELWMSSSTLISTDGSPTLSVSAAAFRTVLLLRFLLLFVFDFFFGFLPLPTL